MAGSRFLQSHLKSLQDNPPRQYVDSLSVKKAVEAAIKKLDAPHCSSN